MLVIGSLSPSSLSLVSCRSRSLILVSAALAVDGLAAAVHQVEERFDKALDVRRVLGRARRELANAVGDDEADAAQECGCNEDCDENGDEARHVEAAANSDHDEEFDKRHKHLLQRVRQHKWDQHGAQPVE